MQLIDFELRGDYITLDALLKATGLASSGGVAKRMVADGRLQVDGQDELRKTCKIRAGQVVSLHGVRISMRSSSTPARLGDETVDRAPLGEGPLDKAPLDEAEGRAA